MIDTDEWISMDGCRYRCNDLCQCLDECFILTDGFRWTDVDRCNDRCQCLDECLILTDGFRWTDVDRCNERCQCLDEND